MSLKVEVAELRYELDKLKKRVVRDEKEGTLDGKEKEKRPPSEYNKFISEHIGEMKGKTPQERFQQVVELYREEQGKGKRKERGQEGKGGIIDSEIWN